jgi:8-oxo-dGTP pyrophosphatase MutT (NUDIX family)
MYKVFFNGSTILFGSEVKKSLKDNIIKKFDLCDYGVVNQIVSDVESGEKPSVFFILNHADNIAWNQFCSWFTEVPAAGGLVENSLGELLFIKRLGVWDLPKGKIEKNETPEFAAIREVEEECGISGLEIVRPLDSTYHIYRSPYHPFPKNLILKETKWFLMRYAGNDTPVPQVDEDIETVSWVAKGEMEQIYTNTYSSLCDFLEKSLLII